MLAPFELARPPDLASALALIGEDAVPYAGGTELLLAMKTGLLRPDALVDLKRIAELRRIDAGDGVLRVGAGCSYDEIVRSAVVRDRAPLLAEVARHVANARVRAQGTIGGNLCFAEPRSDMSTVLAALGATLRLRSLGGTRVLSVPEFLVGAYDTVRAPDELLCRIDVPLPAAVGHYLKYQIGERPLVGVAAVETGQVRRVVVGAVGDLPVVVDAGRWADIDPAGVAGQVDPIDDLAGSAEYKRHATAVHVRRAVARMAADA
jgi:aerobic carbon-monoxide dehydrogenase medium subunit